MTPDVSRYVASVLGVRPVEPDDRDAVLAGAEHAATVSALPPDVRKILDRLELDPTYGDLIAAPDGQSGAVSAAFDPAEPRVPGGEHGGEWSATGAIRDALKLAGKADLQPGEKLVGSDKVAGDSGTIRMALIDHDGHRSVRLGVGGAGFGSRDDEAGPWRAGPDRTGALNAEREKLRAEQKSIEDELDRLDADPHADPARKAALEARNIELEDMGGLGEVFPGGYTANLDQHSAEQLRSTLSGLLDRAAEVDKAVNAHYDEIDRLEAERDKLRHVVDEKGNLRKWTPEEDARWDDLTAQIDALEAKRPPGSVEGDWGGHFSAEGSVPGEWADVHYAVALDDPSVGVEVRLAAVPQGSGRDLSDLRDNEQAALLDAAEAKKFLRLLGTYTGSISAAAGQDLTPGHDELHHYWTKGPGLARWVDSPTPWRTLLANLVEEVKGKPLEVLKKWASRWFIEVKGYAAGSDRNRVEHGHPPRGNRVGPG